MKRMLKWMYMLNKRLYKRGTFLVILILLFAAVCAFTVVSKSESGFIHIALAQEDPNNSLSSAIIEDLLAQDSIVLFTYMETPNAAVDAVKSGGVDGAWIFPEIMEQRGASLNIEKGNYVRVIEREQNVFLRLAREKLHAVLFQYSARALFVEYRDKNLPMLQDLSEEELLSYFENSKIDEDVFVIDNPVASESGKESSYLTAPLRGILAVITVLGGMAGALYYIQDEEKKLFSNLPLKKRPLIAMLCITIATLNVALISMLALCVSGLYAFSFAELLGTLLYALSAASFCMLLKQIFFNGKLLGSVIPALLILISCVCPVFFNLKQLRMASFLFPPTYSIHVAVDKNYLWYMCLYSIACLTLSAVIGAIKTLFLWMGNLKKENK